MPDPVFTPAAVGRPVGAPAAVVAGPPLTFAEQGRLDTLLGTQPRTPTEDAELAALQARSGPVLLPLTPAEIGRLAELRASNLPADSEEMVALAAREGVPLPPDVPPKPDPELVAGLTMDTLTHVVSIVESLAGLMPMAHSLATRVAAMRASLAATVFHASPPVEPPPPARVGPFAATPQQIADRIAMLEALPSRTPEQETELARLKASRLV